MGPVLDWSANFAHSLHRCAVRDLSHIGWWLVALSLAAAEPGGGGYRAEIQKWREGYEADLKKDNGWLTLAGLFWLKEGNNTFGTSAENDIVLPKGSAPGQAGAFLFHDGKTRLRLKDGVRALVNGDPLRTKSPAEIPLNPDTTGKPDRITLGRLSMIVIQRSNRFGIRLWDNNSAVRRDFPG